MKEMLFVFIVPVFFVFLGIHTAKSKKLVQFFANFNVEEVKDVEGHNKALGKLFIAYGITMLICLLPVLSENALFIILSTLGIVFSTIAMIIIYLQVILEKYKNRP